MKSFQIEAWARAVIEQTLAGNPNEDFRVELKADWLQPAKAARRLAGHANAARGEPILWLIGVDEHGKSLNDVKHVELANWYNQVQAQFDEFVAPTLQDLNIVYEGKTIVALLFDTERFPFVVKAQGEQLEIPWREGTRVRSARRSDLFKLLGPLQVLPRTEVLSGRASLDLHSNGELSWYVDLNLYMEPHGDLRLAIPFHKCIAQLEIVNTNYTAVLREIHLAPPGIGLASGWESWSKTVEATQDEVLIYGPGKLKFTARSSVVELPQMLESDVRVTLSFLPVGAEVPAIVSGRLPKGNPSNDSETRRTWQLERQQQ